MEIISIEFEYRDKAYFALVRIKQRDNSTQYHVTIMNGELEQKLYGNHIFVEENEELYIGPLTEKELGELRWAVGVALCKHYDKSYNVEEKTT